MPSRLLPAAAASRSSRGLIATPVSALARHALAAAVAVGLMAVPAGAQTRKPTSKEVSAIRACAAKYKDDVSEGERRCLFKLVADPCSKSEEAKSTYGMAECFRVEQAIWDALLNDNFSALRGGLDSDQTVKLRDMQRAWIAYRDTTCEFYHDKIQGSMAEPMSAACLARETARRALLLDFFGRL